MADTLVFSALAALFVFVGFIGGHVHGFVRGWNAHVEQTRSVRGRPPRPGT